MLKSSWHGCGQWAWVRWWGQEVAGLDVQESQGSFTFFFFSPDLKKSRFYLLTRKPASSYVRLFLRQSSRSITARDHLPYESGEQGLRGERSDAPCTPSAAVLQCQNTSVFKGPRWAYCFFFLRIDSSENSMVLSPPASQWSER